MTMFTNAEYYVGVVVFPALALTLSSLVQRNGKELQQQQREEVTNSRGMKKISIEEIENKNGSSNKMDLEPLFKKSSLKSLRFMLKTVSVLCFGFIVLAYSPWYTLPIGVTITAIAMSWMYVIAQDCVSNSFFPSKIANNLFGGLLLVPFMNVGYDNIMIKHENVGRILSGIGLFLITYFIGAPNLVKYWLLPLFVMHFQQETSFFTDKKGYMMLFPELNTLFREIDTKYILPTNLNDCFKGNIPIYNLPMLVTSVKTLFKTNDLDVPEETPESSSTLSQLYLWISREVFFWETRDYALYICGTLATLVILISNNFGMLSCTPLLALLPFLLIHSPTQTVTELCVAVHKHEEETLKKRIKRWIANANWGMGSYITLCHVGACYGAYVLPTAHWSTLIFAFTLWPISGLGITAGAHRLWSHKSYEASFIVRLFLMICNSIANQGSLYHWSRDHRVHHKYSETEADPHNAERGFFFAHMGWLYQIKDKRVYEAGNKLNLTDLLADPLVRLQKRLDPFWNLFWCFGFPTSVSVYFFNESVVNGLFVAGFLRYVYVLHCTWLVNSAAHFIGNTPYDDIKPAENRLVAICAIGEGWHNYHHAYPSDYATSELGISEQFNPTKLFIDTCFALGLVWNLKRSDKLWEMKKSKMKQTHTIVESLHGPPLLKTRYIDKLPKEQEGEDKIDGKEKEDQSFNKNLFASSMTSASQVFKRNSEKTQVVA